MSNPSDHRLHPCLVEAGAGSSRSSTTQSIDRISPATPRSPSHPPGGRGRPLPFAPNEFRSWALIAALVFALGWLFGEFRTRTGWDDTYYLLQVSSLVEDGDLDLRNDALYSGLSPRDLQTFLTSTLPSGTLKNTFSIGPSVLWLPAYFAATPGRATTDAPSSLRWRRAQLAALHLLSLGFLAAVACLLYRLLQAGGVDHRLALLATLVLLAGTPLAVYGPAVYTMAHLPSVAAISLFVASLLWLAREPRSYRALLTGAALGLVFLVRWQDAVFGLLLWVPLAPLLGERRDLPRLMKMVAATAAGGLATASLQLHVWHSELGSWLTMPQGGEYMRWSQPHLRELLFSGYSGLLPWSPVFALAAVGLLLPWRCSLSPRWRVAVLLVLATQVYVSAAVRDWWGGDSFGARRLTSCVPLLAIGLANLAVSCNGRWRPLAPVKSPLSSTGSPPQTPRSPSHPSGGAGDAPSPSLRTGFVLVLAALCLWGCFTTNLWWRHVRDLSLVAYGRPSAGALEAPAESGVVTDPAQARRLALRPVVRRRLRNYFAEAGGGSRWLGVLATAALMGAAVAGTCLLVFRAPGGLLLQGVLLVLLAMILWCHVRLTLGPRPDLAERAVWQQVSAPWSDLRRQLAPLAARAEAQAALLQARPQRPSPADAYLYLALLAHWEAAEPRPALRLLAGLADQGYPVAVALRQRVQALGPGVEALVVAPGTFFQPLPGAASCSMALPAGSGQKALDLVFDLQLGSLEPGAIYDVATLQDANRFELMRVSFQGTDKVQLATPRQAVAAALPAVAGASYQMRLRYQPDAGAISLEVSGSNGGRERLAAQLAAPGTEPAQVLFGRNRQGHASFPLWSSAFSELWVTGQLAGLGGTAGAMGPGSGVR